MSSADRRSAAEDALRAHTVRRPSGPTMQDTLVDLLVCLRQWAQREGIDWRVVRDYAESQS